MTITMNKGPKEVLLMIGIIMAYVLMILWMSTLDAQLDDSSSYVCTDDCSGHEAGYEWAEDKGITDPDDCGGNSQSFIEGCESYTKSH